MTDVVVAMLTYRRPQDLAVAVPAFLAEVRPHGGSLLVVDNDPDGGAREYVTGLGDERVRYVHEPRPGIAAGRNRALDEVGDELLVFVDDDERPVAGWLQALLDCRARTGAAVVVGAVVSEFEEPPPDWVVAGRVLRPAATAHGHERRCRGDQQPAPRHGARPPDGHPVRRGVRAQRRQRHPVHPHARARGAPDGLVRRGRGDRHGARRTG